MAVTVVCDEKSMVDKAANGALSPAAQSGVERCRLFLSPPSALAQGSFLEKREIQSMVTDSRHRFLEAWNEFFGIVGA